MRYVYPDDMGDASLEQFWMQNLPPAVRNFTDGLSGSLDALAECADRVTKAARGGTELAAISAASKRRFAAIFPSSGELEPEEAREVAATTNVDTRINTLEIATQVASLAQNRPARDVPQPPAPTRSNKMIRPAGATITNVTARTRGNAAILVLSCYLRRKIRMGCPMCNILYQRSK